MYEIRVRTRFSSAHHLRGYPGDCAKVHGHNWEVAVRLAAPSVDALGMVLDFREVKRHLQAVVGELDHQYLNDLPAFQERNPTTEHVAQFICEGLAQRLPEGVMVRSVTAWESPGCGVTYTPDWDEGARP